jgi:hypothetical protein
VSSQCFANDASESFINREERILQFEQRDLEMLSRNRAVGSLHALGDVSDNVIE